MLRLLFGESPREWGQEKDDRLARTETDAIRTMERFVRWADDRARAMSKQEAVRRYHKLAVWAEGLLRSLDELEQSRYAAEAYAARIAGIGSLEEMNREQRLNYYRHVYFDKNAYVRVFALLDKLGTLMNELLGLHTERVKPKFSYFTVLRNMRQRRLHPELADRLGEVKDARQQALSRLRSRRNTEVHYMNAELQDDLEQPLFGGEDRQLENIRSNLDDLAAGYDMIVTTLLLVFRYAGKQAR